MIASFRQKPKAWISIVVIILLGALLAGLDGRRLWLAGWLAYCLVAGLGIGSIYWFQRLIGCPPGPASASKLGAWETASLSAFYVRLAVGVGLALLLPVFGYKTNIAMMQGYLYKDSYVRDEHALALARSDQSLLTAFTSEKDQGDQYGGLLALSAGVYRYIGLGIHRRFLILILTATMAAWAVLFTWRVSLEWFGERVANVTAWIVALYPESVFLGSSQMREAFVIAGVAICLYSLVEFHNKRRSGLAWLVVAAVILFLIQPPLGLVAFLITFIVWGLGPERRFAVRYMGLLAGILLAGLFLVTLVWSSLPSMQGASQWNILFLWLQKNFTFQSQVTESGSSPLSKIIQDLGPRFRLPAVLSLGIAQPVLPALVGDPGAAWITRLIGLLRAGGWYALAPFLVYGLISVFRARQEPRQRQLIWMGIVIWAWILITAAAAGGDQWDNPRYRTDLLPWMAILAAWAWQWAAAHKDAWLGRWLVVEAIFVITFTLWYIRRYYLLGVPFGIWAAVLLTLVLAVIILGGGWLVDRRKRI